MNITFISLGLNMVMCVGRSNLARTLIAWIKIAKKKLFVDASLSLAFPASRRAVYTAKYVIRCIYMRYVPYTYIFTAYIQACAFML